MRIIALIVDTAIVRDILADLGEPTAPPKIAPARGPFTIGGGRHRSPSLCRSAPKLAPDFDQRLSC